MLCPPEFSSVMALDEYMVVRERRGQQVLADDRGRLDPNLRTAKVLLVLATRYLDVDCQEALEVVAQLDERVFTRSHFAVDSNTDTGLEMIGELMLLGHLKGDRTFSEQDLTFRSDTCGVRHPTGFTRQTLAGHEGQQHRYIAFATGRDAFVIEFGNSQTAGVLAGGEQIEATEGDTVQFVLIDDHFEADIDILCALHTRINLT